MRKSIRIREDYDNMAGVYNLRYSRIQREKYRIALKGIKLGGKILDLGAGTGLLSEFLGTKLISADISLNMLSQCKSNSVQTTAESLPFKDKSFDAVVSFSALMNFENPENALKEVRRVLKKDGIFICTYLKKFNFDKLLKKQFKIIKKINCGEDIGYYLC